MQSRRPIDAVAAGLMALLCAIWGLQQVSLKLTAGEVAPLTMIALRSGVAALLVALVRRVRGERIVGIAGRWRAGVAVGALFALEYLLLGEALRYTQASHATVFLYTAPVFAALGLQWRVPGERLYAAQWAGVGLAFAGIALTFWGRGAAAAGAVPGASLLGDGLALLAGAAWGATTVAIRASVLSAAPATETLLYQLVVGFIVLGAASLATGVHRVAITPALVGHFAFQALVVSFVSFLCWFWLLRRYLASRLGVLSFMTPLMGVGFAIWLLKEPMDARFVLGSGLVLAGVVVVAGYGGWRQGAGRAAAPRTL